MLSSVFTTHNNDPPLWFYDFKRSRMLISETESESARRAEKKARTEAERKEQERIFQKRRAAERSADKRLQEKRDADRRAMEIEGRIKQLTAKALSDDTDTKSRSELSYARTQLFWTKSAASAP